MSVDSSANVTTIERSNTEVWTNGNVAAIDDLYAEDFTTKSMPPHFPQTRDGFKQWIAYYHSAFSNVSLVNDDVVAEGDKVATRWTARGTHTGEFMGIPATNHSFEMQGLTIFRLANGRIAEDWTQADTMALMQQLGMMESPS